MLGQLKVKPSLNESKNLSVLTDLQVNSVDSRKHIAAISPVSLLFDISPEMIYSKAWLHVLFLSHDPLRKKGQGCVDYFIGEQDTTSAV